MKKVVICDTALASSNVGDEIIFDSICNGMSDVFEENFSLRLATHVNNFSAKQVAHSYVTVSYTHLTLPTICSV